jgi:DNA-binding LytR/AlgR family response regulator
MKMECVIIEDLKVAADYLQKCCEKSGRLDVKGSFPDVQSALDFLNKTSVDLLFLDVEMPGATGFELLDRIAYQPKVILTTSKEKYAYNAFQYHVSDFLKKPFTYARFNEAIDKVTESHGKPSLADNSPDHLFIRTEGKLVRLNNEDILYIESMGDYVKFVTHDKKYITHNSLRNLEEKISKACFIKVHRSYIVNMHKIDDIRENDIRINGFEIPISKHLRSEVMQKITIL